MVDLFNTKSILKEKRYVWIDSDKGISIILVAYGHSLIVLREKNIDLSDFPFFNYIGIFLHGFRMPLFFIISGIFIASGLVRKGFDGYIKNRADTVLYPLLVWGSIQITIQMIISLLRHQPINLYNYLYLLVQPRSVGSGQFWYLNALFFISVLYAITKNLLKLTPYLQVFIGLLLYAFASFLHLNDYNLGLVADICEFYFFFSLGDVISSTVLKESFVKKFASFKVFFPLLVLFLITQYYFAKINLQAGNDTGYVEQKMPLFFLFEAILGCTISINFSFLLQKYNGLRFLRVIGFHSLFIYCMQLITMMLARVILISVFKIHYVPLLIFGIWIIGILFPILFYNFCLKINWWWLFSFRNPKRTKKKTEEIQKTESIADNSLLLDKQYTLQGNLKSSRK